MSLQSNNDHGLARLAVLAILTGIQQGMSLDGSVQQITDKDDLKKLLFVIQEVLSDITNEEVTPEMRFYLERLSALIINRL